MTEFRPTSSCKSRYQLPFFFLFFFFLFAYIMLSIIINNIINIQHADANNADESRPTRMPANNTPSIDPFQKERYSISTYLHTYFHTLSVNSVFTGTLRMKFRYVDAALLHQESMSVSPCCPLDKRLLLSITSWEWIISAANKADGTPKIANSSLSSLLVWTLHGPYYCTSLQHSPFFARS